MTLKSTLKVEFWHFSTPPHYTYSQISIIDLGYVHFYAKIFSILYPLLENLTTHNTITNTLAIWNGEELPEEPQQEKLYSHCIKFFETMTESLMQLCLNCLILREFGVSTNGFEASNQISGLCSSLISIILLFAKRQSLIEEKFIPKFFSITLWKHVLICGVPWVALFLTFLAVAFTADSLGMIIMSIGFMLNPIVSVPLSLFMTSILDGIQQLIKKMCKAPASESRFKFTISAYFALICAFQMYLTSRWDAGGEIFIKKFKGAKVQPIVMNSYDNTLKFDQCNCSTSCKLPNGTRPEIDIGEYVDLWTPYEIALPYIILGFLLLIISYCVVECFVGKQISMQMFILGPQNERNGPTINNEGEQTKATEKKSKRSKNKKKCSAVMIISIVSILMILLSPDTIFDQLYNVDQLFCKDGFYNSVNSSEGFNCKACECNTISNVCSEMYKRTSACQSYCYKELRRNISDTGRRNRRGVTSGQQEGGAVSGCNGTLITTPTFKRGNIEKVDTDGFSQHWNIKANKINDRAITCYIKVVGTCCWEITDNYGYTEEFGIGDEKEPKIWYITTIKTKKCA